MRLVNTRTFELETFTHEGHAPGYAILSHTWGDGELTLQDMQHQDDNVKRKAGYEKLQSTCTQARTDELDYVWIDCCCIDKTSSADLSNAINSMYRYYEQAVVCYVHLVDINLPYIQALHSSGTERCGDEKYEISGLAHSQKATFSVLRNSRWFTRGWTLQELLAPRQVQFFDTSWKYIGGLAELDTVVSRITAVPLDALRKHTPLKHFSIAKRMSWASRRDTTILEDEAYSLMGLFGVNMPLLYGEGSNAFARLQHAITSTSCDQSIFAWGRSHPGYWFPRRCLLASSPYDFRDCDGVASIINTHPGRTFYSTNQGLRIALPLLRMSRSGKYLAFLACYTEGRPDQVIALPIVVLESGEAVFHGADQTTCNAKLFRQNLEKAQTIVFTGRSLSEIASSSQSARRISVRFLDESRHKTLSLSDGNLRTEYECCLRSVSQRSAWDLGRLTFEPRIAHGFVPPILCAGFAFFIESTHGRKFLVRVAFLSPDESFGIPAALSAALVTEWSNEDINVNHDKSRLQQACLDLKQSVDNAASTLQGPWTSSGHVLRGECTIPLFRDKDRELHIKFCRDDALDSIRIAVRDSSGILDSYMKFLSRELNFLKELRKVHWLRKRRHHLRFKFTSINEQKDGDVQELDMSIYPRPVTTSAEIWDEFLADKKRTIRDKLSTASRLFSKPFKNFR